MTNTTYIGRITRADRNQFTILENGTEFPARLRGQFFEDDCKRPVVGDLVRFSLPENSDAMIEEILPRSTILKRADQSGHGAGYVKTMQEQVMVANVNYVFILTSLNDNYNLNRIARYVSVTLDGGASPVVILTKSDLCPDVTPFINEVRALSEKVRVHAISTYTGEGLESIETYLQDGNIIALLGSSGVGKSTLVNKLAGREIMKTGDIRESDGKGRHTTTSRQLFMLDSGVILIDTPGMREFGLIDADEGIADTFSDIDELASSCKYRDCTHRNEPGCAIKAAISAGLLDKKRLRMYQSMMGESQQNFDKKRIAIQRKRLNKADNRKKW